MSEGKFKVIKIIEPAFVKDKNGVWGWHYKKGRKFIEKKGSDA